MELSSEAPSVKSGHSSHWGAALTSPALPNPSKVSPTRWLWGAVKTRLFSVVNASLPATHPYKYQLLSASHWSWGSQKETVPEESGENGGTTASILSFSPPVISNGLNSHNKFTEHLWIPSLVYDFLPASSGLQPSPRFFYILNFSFFLQGMIGFSSPLILSCWSVAGRWTSWWLHLLRHHLQHLKAEVQKNASHKNSNLILVNITPSSLAYQYVCHHHFQNCPEGISHCSQVMW